jgi:hypothetical protein
MNLQSIGYFLELITDKEYILHLQAS